MIDRRWKICKFLKKSKVKNPNRAEKMLEIRTLRRVYIVQIKMVYWPRKSCNLQWNNIKNIILFIFWFGFYEIVKSKTAETHQNSCILESEMHELWSQLSK